MRVACDDDPVGTRGKIAAMLTRKQYELLIYIDRHLKQTGFSPSFEEMKDALKLKSKSGIHRLISALEERGFLGRRHHRARALEVLRLPENRPAAPAARPWPRRPARASRPMSSAAISRHDPGRARGERRGSDPVAALWPHRRRPADRGAARPEQLRRYAGALLGSGEHYALEVAGDSMVEAGILDGDTVIIRKGDVAETGQIVVALVDENEVTLKRLRRRGNSIALEPCNVRHETRIFPADRVKVQGRLVALLRRY